MTQTFEITEISSRRFQVDVRTDDALEASATFQSRDKAAAWVARVAPNATPRQS